MLGARFTRGVVESLDPLGKVIMLFANGEAWESCMAYYPLAVMHDLAAPLTFCSTPTSVHAVLSTPVGLSGLGVKLVVEIAVLFDVMAVPTCKNFSDSEAVPLI